MFFQDEAHLHRANQEEYYSNNPDGQQEPPVCRFDSSQELLEVNLAEDPYQQAGSDENSYDEFDKLFGGGSHIVLD